MRREENIVRLESSSELKIVDLNLSSRRLYKLQTKISGHAVCLCLSTGCLVILVRSAIIIEPIGQEIWDKLYLYMYRNVIYLLISYYLSIYQSIYLSLSRQCTLSIAF